MDLEENNSLPEDKPEVILHLASEVDNNNTSAMHDLGMIYINRYKEISETTKNGIKLLEKAIQFGNRDAMYDLAEVYRRGKGVPSNQEKGDELIKQAAEHGHLDAIKEILSRMYYIGGDGPSDMYPEVDKKEYIKYLENLTESKNEPKNRIRSACMILMGVYRDGDYVNKHLNKALFYAGKAVELGDTTYAATNVKMLKRQLKDS
jgi:TPR repeat protein